MPRKSPRDSATPRETCWASTRNPAGRRLPPSGNRTDHRTGAPSDEKPGWAWRRQPGRLRWEIKHALTLDSGLLDVYTSNMGTEKTPKVGTPCLCFALRQASRAVSRFYDEELRTVGLRTTQYSLLRFLQASGE